VRQVAAIFFRHAAFLRPVMLVSAAHPEIRRRGSYYGRELGDLVTAALMHARGDIDHPDPETAVRGAFNTVFATLVMRVAYGPVGAGNPVIAVDLVSSNGSRKPSSISGCGESVDCHVLDLPGRPVVREDFSGDPEGVVRAGSSAKRCLRLAPAW
jgi:hypothetical protein